MPSFDVSFQAFGSIPEELLSVPARYLSPGSWRFQTRTVPSPHPAPSSARAAVEQGDRFAEDQARGRQGPAVRPQDADDPVGGFQLLARAGAAAGDDADGFQPVVARAKLNANPSQGQLE